MVKVALITDIHKGPKRNSGTKLGHEASRLMKNFIQFAKKRRIAAVFDLGDRVNDTSYKVDRGNLIKLKHLFKQLSVKTHHLLGNHDVENMTMHDHAQIMDYDFSSKIVRFGGVDFILWNANVDLDEEKGFDLKRRNFKSLRELLKKAHYPAVICTHVPLDNSNMEGNFYFNKRAKPHQAHYPENQADRVRNMIEESGKVVMCLSGHAHWENHSCIDGIHYITIPSLTESFMTHPKPQGAFAILDINPQRGIAEIEIYGERPSKHALTLRRQNEHWIRLDKPERTPQFHARPG